MYVIVILKYKSPYLYYARRLLIFSVGKGNGNAWADRDKNKPMLRKCYDLGGKQKTLPSSRTAGLKLNQY